MDRKVGPRGLYDPLCENNPKVLQIFYGINDPVYIGEQAGGVSRMNCAAVAMADSRHKHALIERTSFSGLLLCGYLRALHGDGRSKARIVASRSFRRGANRGVIAIAQNQREKKYRPWVRGALGSRCLEL